MANTLTFQYICFDLRLSTFETLRLQLHEAYDLGPRGLAERPPTSSIFMHAELHSHSSLLRAYADSSRTRGRRTWTVLN